MKEKKNWLQRFFSVTPAEKRRIRNSAVVCIAILVAIGKGAVGMTTPQWYVDYAWYAYSLLIGLSIWAQGYSKEMEVKND